MSKSGHMKTGKGSVIMVLIAVLCLCSCHEGEQETTGNTALYCINEAGTALVAVYTDIESMDATDYVAVVLEQMKQAAQENALQYALPSACRILSTSVTNACANIDFTAEYYQQETLREVLCRAAIVKTLCQYNGSDKIDYVVFTVEGQPMILRGETPIGMMRGEDFLESVGMTLNYQQTATVMVCFATPDGNALVESYRDVRYDGSISMEQLVIEQLIAGPVELENGMYTAIPNGTKLNRVSSVDGICYVDFNEAFLEDMSGITEEVTIYSIVNSLAELAYINKVQFTVNGEKVTFYNTIPFDTVFERNLDIMASIN